MPSINDLWNQMIPGQGSLSDRLYVWLKTQIDNPSAPVTTQSAGVGRKITVWDSINKRQQLIYGDTGWRDLSGSLINGWTAGAVPAPARVRRVGYLVTIRAYGLNGTAATAAAAFTLPVGFRPPNTEQVLLRGNGANPILGSVDNVGNYSLPVGTEPVNIFGGVEFLTTEAWPTTLPGTAFGTIPNA